MGEKGKLQLNLHPRMQFSYICHNPPPPGLPWQYRQPHGGKGQITAQLASQDAIRVVYFIPHPRGCLGEKAVSWGKRENYCSICIPGCNLSGIFATIPHPRGCLGNTAVSWGKRANYCSICIPGCNSSGIFATIPHPRGVHGEMDIHGGDGYIAFQFASRFSEQCNLISICTLFPPPNRESCRIPSAAPSSWTSTMDPLPI